MSWNFEDHELQQYIDNAEYGIEKESLRVTPKGTLAQTPHPFTEGSIDRDFCENQAEMITSVHRDAESLMKELTEIHKTVNDRLKGMNELLWPFSNPPIVHQQEDIPVARFDGALKEREIYRDYLANKYGKTKMLYSGIHFNFSFSEELLKAVFRRSKEEDYRRFKDHVYLELSRKLLRYTWLVVYLTAASPLADDSFIRLSGMNGSDRYRYASFRCSEVGYWNDFLPVLDFTTVEKYADSIQSYIDRRLLYAASELYYPLRLKPRGKNSLEALKDSGVNHIELRCLDVNPLSPVGLFREDIRFIHLLMVYLMSLEDISAGEKAQRIAIENVKTAALFNDTENTVLRGGQTISVRHAASDTLDEIERFTEAYAPAFVPDVLYQKRKLNGQRYAETVRNSFRSYITDGLRLAEKYRG
ncbi:MAG: hypothetical protein IJV48_02785 [Ruminococcus sp.]|nr:hypothetical protein [Ruminococcus sp.]